MKKLKFIGKPLSREELKNITGGVVNSGGGSSFSNTISLGVAGSGGGTCLNSGCSVTFMDVYGTVTGRQGGTCRMQQNYNTITCYCDAVPANSKLTNASSLSHCWANPA